MVEIYQYVKAFGQMQRSIDSIPKYNTAKTFFDIVVNNPFVIVPQSSESETEFFKCDLGKAHISNEISIWEEVNTIQNVFVTISKCNINAITQDIEYKLLNNIDGTLTFHLPLDDKDHKLPVMTLSVVLEEVILVIHQKILDLF